MRGRRLAALASGFALGAAAMATALATIGMALLGLAGVVAELGTGGNARLAVAPIRLLLAAPVGALLALGLAWLGLLVRRRL
jgi:hypothetical protein